MKKLFQQPNIYIALAILQVIFNSLELSQSLIRLAYTPLYLMSLYYVIRVFKDGTTSIYIKALNKLFLLVMIYGVIAILIGTDSSWLGYSDPKIALLHYYESISPIYAYYYFSKHKMIDEKWFRIILVFLVIVVYYKFLDEKKNQLSHYIHKGEDVTNYIGYYWASLVAFVYFFKDKPFIQYPLLTIFTALTVSGFKRGAIISLIPIVILFIIYSLKNKKTTTKLVSILFLGAGVYVILNFLSDLYLANDYFVSRIMATQEGSMSGRDRIWDRLLDLYINRSNAFQLIFGFGAQSTVRYIGIQAHNDWIEFLINYGLIGFFVNLLFWFRSFKEYILSRSLVSKEIQLIFLSCMILMFLKTFFSMSLNDIFFGMAALIGFCVSRIEQAKLQAQREFTNNPFKQ